MAFLIDKEQLKPGLIIFRRTDVQHRNFYCRAKLPNVDRYKTIALKTPDVGTAREKAFDHDADLRFRIKHDVPIFNRSFSEVGKEYILVQEVRAKNGEISATRLRNVRSMIEGPLNSYVGTTQVHLIGEDTWTGYPAWRRENGIGRYHRNRDGVPKAKAAQELQAADIKGKRAANAVVKRVRQHGDPIVSDETIRIEMSVFSAVMNFAISKRYVPASQRFEAKPALKTMRRDEFTLEEYRRLHTVARSWIAKATTPASVWYRTAAYNFILIMCNTGMRPPEARNLRWRDVMPAKDREGREIVVLFVRGKGKSRKLVAPKSVGDYLDRIRNNVKAETDAERRAREKLGLELPAPKIPELDDPVFTTITGKLNDSLYAGMIEELLISANLRIGPNGVPRTIYCFRHTYATLRLHEGVDVYFLAEQMGTSVKMIEDHYGHVNTIKHADRVLQGMGGWEPIEDASDAEGDMDAKGAKAIAAKQPAKPRRITHAA